jgi:glyoxylase-like metal-dependent hydrolase (beta-lactamase superfamily II)
MATTTFKVGDMTVHRIIEMECGFTPALEFLPNLTPQMLEESRSWMTEQKALDPQDLLVLCFQAYIVRTGRHIILVDSCIGNDKDRPARPVWNMKTDSVFMDGLKEVGLTVNDIDFVLCTHLHVDHVGWNTRLENGRWVPTFPKAKYLFSKVELDFWLAENDKTTIDHYAVTLGRNGKDAVITGDLIHTPLQAKWPDLAMRIDYDGLQSSATRWKFLEQLCDTNTQCCFAHFPSPSRGYIKRWGDGFKCEYITG